MLFDSRTDIIMATWNVIAEKGIEGVRIRQIAAEAGVSQGRIQHQFKTRDGLIVESCRALMDMSARQYGSSKPTPEQKLMDTVGHALPTSDMARHISHAWNAYAMSIGARPEIAQLFADYKRNQEAEAAAILEEIGLAPADAQREARCLVALGDGLTQRVLTNYLTPEEAVEALTAAFPRGPKSDTGVSGVSAPEIASDMQAREVRASQTEQAEKPEQSE